jgi:hypothetical protein
VKRGLKLKRKIPAGQTREFGSVLKSVRLEPLFWTLVLTSSDLALPKATFNDLLHNILKRATYFDLKNSALESE